jgi:four helix bundle protein
MDKNEFIEHLKKRTKEAALRIVKLFQSLPKTDEARVIGKQLLRSGTSFAANYRAVCRARSKAEFFAKLSIVVEELDESLFWIEMLVDSNILSEEKTMLLSKELEEILSILSHARKNI